MVVLENNNLHNGVDTDNAIQTPAEIFYELLVFPDRHDAGNSHDRDARGRLKKSEPERTHRVFTKAPFV